MVIYITKRTKFRETLVISFVGMQTQEVTIKPHVKVILKSDSELLEEVVVTGYGTFKKHHLLELLLL